MRLGGFQKVTLSDFPGRVAAIVFTDGCNFRCPFCHNGDLVVSGETPREEVPVEEVMAYLERRRGFIQGLVITGGEPTLHRDLPDFIRSVRALGYQIKLDTNGSNPDMLAKMLAEGLVDFVAMDIKAPFWKYDPLTGVPTDIRNVRRSMNLIADSGIDHLFRTTVVPQLLTEADVEEIRAQIPAGSNYLRQDFNPDHVLDPALLEKPVLEPAERELLAGASD